MGTVAFTALIFLLVLLAEFALIAVARGLVWLVPRAVGLFEIARALVWLVMRARRA